MHKHEEALEHIAQARASLRKALIYLKSQNVTESDDKFASKVYDMERELSKLSMSIYEELRDL